MVVAEINGKLIIIHVGYNMASIVTDVHNITHVLTTNLREKKILLTLNLIQNSKTILTTPSPVRALLVIKLNRYVWNDFTNYLHYNLL